MVVSFTINLDSVHFWGFSHFTCLWSKHDLSVLNYYLFVLLTLINRKQTQHSISWNLGMRKITKERFSFFFLPIPNVNKIIRRSDIFGRKYYHWKKIYFSQLHIWLIERILFSLHILIYSQEKWHFSWLFVCIIDKRFKWDIEENTRCLSWV